MGRVPRKDGRMLKNLTDEQLEKKLEEARQQDDLMTSLRDYSGSDKLMTSEEAVKLASELEKTESIKSKLPSLDEMIKGFRAGELVVVSGSTGEGKTTFCQTLTKNFAEQDISCLWFSFEVGYADLLERFGAKVPFFTLPSEMQSSVTWIESKIWEGKAKYNTQVIFIDHLHYLLEMSKLGTNASLVIGGILRELKKLAIKTQTTIFLISHVTKLGKDAEPSIEDLRDSSFSGQEADVVLLIWRLEEDGDYLNKSVVKVDKSRRTGNRGKVKLVFKEGSLYEEANTGFLH